MPYAVHSGLDSDPRERTIRALVDEMRSQRSSLSNLEKQLGNLAPPSSEKRNKNPDRNQATSWRHGFNNQ